MCARISGAKSPGVHQRRVLPGGASDSAANREAGMAGVLI